MKDIYNLSSKERILQADGTKSEGMKWEKATVISREQERPF